MKKNLSYIILIIAVLFTTNLYGQIGNIIPDNRLPYEDDGTTLSWTLAGYEGEIPYAEETIDVTHPDYGAVGDGVTDDTDAIRSAISVANDDIVSEIYFPPGIYLIEGFPLAGEEDIALELPPNIILKGAGSDVTELKFLIGGDGHDPDANYIPHCIRISGTSSNKIGNVGIEDMTIRRYNEVLNTQIYLWFTDNTFTDKVKGSNIVISNAENCWVIGVESDNPLKHHISISNSNNIEVTGCYIHDPQFTCGMGYGYGVCVSNSSYSLVENNIFSKCRHSMILGAETFNNVFGYNFSREPRQSDHNEVCKDFTGDICLHGNSGNPGSSVLKPKNNLFEGNIVWQIKVDHIFGTNGNYNTFFRNRSDTYGIWLDEGGKNEKNNHQTVVNNYVKCYNWLYCILGYPRKFEPDHFFEKNTVVKKVNFWGTAYTRTWSDDKQNKTYPNSWTEDVSYYYEEQPEFMCFCEWPMHPKNDTNEANRRWNLGGKRTWGREDIYEFTTEIWSGVIQIGGPGSGNDVVIPMGHKVIISPGSTLEIYPFDKLVVKGCLIAEGTENDSILFTVQDDYPGTINCYGISFEMTINPGESSLKYCKFEHFRSYEWPYNIDVFTPNTHGGAIYVENYDNLTIDSCSFIHNIAYVGGAICLKNSNITIENSEFRNNFGDCGGAIMSSSSSPIIINNIIDNNRCVGGKDLLIQAGGGIYLDGSDSDKIYLTNNVISNNIACIAGGIAICNCNDKVVCMNNTITNNDVDGGGCGGIWIDTSNDIFINNIFWDNTAPQISVSSPNSATMSFYNCDIQGGIEGIDFAWVNFEGEAVNIIDADPNFIGSGDHPYAITWNTECYNNGRTPDSPADSLLEYLLPKKDPSGNPRIVLDIIDIGAYEAYEPGIYVEDDEFGFGDVSIENIGLQTFEIQNESMSELLYIDSITVRTYIYIDSTETEVSGFTVEANAFVIYPGYSISRDITFNPELVFEDYYGEIVIYSSDPYFPEVTINLTGRGIPSEYQEVFGEISSDETWEGYILLTGDVTITNGATLTMSENSEVYIVDGYKLSLESGNIIMNNSKLYLRNNSEIDINGTITLSGGSLIEVTSCSEFRLEPGSSLYGTDHTIWVDTDTGKGYDTWVEMHEAVPNHNGNMVMIPGDKVVVNNAGKFIAYSNNGDDRITITSVGDDYYWDGIEINDGGWDSYIYGCDISKISHIKLNNSMLELVSSTFSDCNQIIARNESEIEFYCNTFENNRACPIVLYESDGIISNNSIINNEGNGISIYYPPLYGSVSVSRDTIQYNNGRGVDLYNVPAMFKRNVISYNGNPDNPNSARSIGFFASGNSGGANMGGNTIENNYGIEILATRDAFPNLTFELYYYGANIINDEYDPDGYIYLDQFLLACGGYDGNPIDVCGNDFPNDNDPDFEDRFLPLYDAYLFDGEKPTEKILYDEGITEIADSLYESAKCTMKEIVDIYPETETAKNALQWLMYLEKFSGQDYATLRSYIENIDSELYSHLERTKYNTITSTYMAEKNYEAAITRLEDILADPPSIQDSIFAYIDEGYCYLNLDEQGSKSLPVICCFKPKCFEEFSYVSQNLLDNALSASKPPAVNPPIVEFALHQNYPNPALHSTTFSFLIPANTKNAELKIYNIKGQLVKTFKSDTIKKGTSNKITWNCKDDDGKILANGIYFYKLKADQKEKVKKMILLR